MTLAARARLFAVLFIAVTLVALGILLYAQGRMEQARVAANAIDAIRGDSSKLRTSLFDYALHRDAQRRAQADGQFRHLRAQIDAPWIATAASTRPDQERRLRAVVSDAFEDSAKLFGQLSASEALPAAGERGTRTRELLLLKSQDLVGALNALDLIFMEDLENAGRNYKNVAYALSGLVLIIVLLTVVMIELYVLRPLSRLRQTADAVANGNLSLRLHSRRADEIGVLAVAFDSMLDSIQAMTVTRDRLNAEVAERIKAEAALQVSEQRLGTILEGAADAILVADPAGRFVYANPQAGRLLGYSVEELLGLGIPDITPAGDMDETWALVQRLHAESNLRVEFNRLCKDGRTIPVEMTAVRLPDGNLCGVMRDISERKRDEAQLRDNEARLRQLFESSRDALQLLGAPTWTYFDANQASLQLFGVKNVAEFTMLGPWDVSPQWQPDGRASAEKAQEMIATALREGSHFFEWEHQTLDGRPFASDVLLTRMESADGLFVQVTVRDISERKRAEEQLRKLTLAVEQSPASILVTDLAGKIEYVNEAFIRVSGHSREETLGLNPRVLQSGKTPRETYTAMWEALGQGRTWKGEFTNRRKNGEEYFELAHISPIRQPDGHISHYVAVQEDITEKKRLGQELDRHRQHLEGLVEERTRQLAAAKQTAEMANRAKSTFLASMSHEIRTPMNGVLGMVEVLKRSRLTEHQTDLLKTIHDSGALLLRLIDDILDFSKIEAGRMEIGQAPVSVVDVVEGLCSSLLPLATGKGVDLSVFVSPRIPDCVLTDEVRLRQLLYNIVGNAIKFSAGQPEHQGRVSVRAEVVQSSPLRVAFRVADNGIGIAPETMRNLFQPFTQAEASTTRRFGGTGLGLAICKRLTELMQGTIAAESAPGEGSTFTVDLPFELPAEQAVPKPPVLAGVACIVVEDPDYAADDMSAYLDAGGAHVLRVADPGAAAQAAANLPAPVVLVQRAESEQATPAAVHTRLATLPHLRHLLITRGRRRQARQADPDTVTLDGSVLRHQALLRAVAVLADRASPEVFHDTAEERLAGARVAPPSVAEARAQGKLILVAEDDPINQKVIQAQLGLLGYAAEIAANGTEALSLWRAWPYALMLTDLHMPEMDGYTLAKTIRDEEAGTRQMPILALTANALRGEADHALAAGMDAYLTKPVPLEQLRSTLQKWMPLEQASPLPAAAQAAAATPQTGVAVDVAVLKALVGDDEEIVREFLSDYRDSARRLAADLRAACAAANTREVGSIAHKLKSSSRSVGALALGELCAGLESAAKAGDKQEIAKDSLRFDTVLAEVDACIATLLID